MVVMMLRWLSWCWDGCHNVEMVVMMLRWLSWCWDGYHNDRLVLMAGCLEQRDIARKFLLKNLRCVKVWGCTCKVNILNVRHVDLVSLVRAQDARYVNSVRLGDILDSMNVCIWFDKKLSKISPSNEFVCEEGLGLVVHIPSGCVAKINIPWPWPKLTWTRDLRLSFAHRRLHNLLVYYGVVE